jgi:FecR-like protein
MLIREPKRHFIWFVVSALAATLMFSFINPAAGQSQRQPEPETTEASLSGFMTDGGVINLIEGEVAYFTSGGQAARIKPKQYLSNQDAIQTGPNGRAEILLSPGYYLRLAANTYVVFLDLSPDNLKLKISRGSAIFEVLVVSDPFMYFGNSARRRYPAVDEPMTISTPAGEFVTVKGGIYRFDVSDSETDLKVTKGLSVVAGAQVESGMEATLRNGSASVMKFNKDAGDEFDVWSRERAGQLVNSNQSLRNTDWHRQLRRNPRSYIDVRDRGRHERSNERYVVSAIGGFVSFLEAGVTYKHGEAAWTELTEGVGLETGDRVKTGPDSRAEILVYPNCYLRLAGDTEIVYTLRSDGYAAIELVRGSAIISSRLDGKEHTPVSFVAPQAECEILRKGVYRLNRSASGHTELLVYEGRARIAGREIKDGRKAVFAEGGPAITTMQKKAVDSFDVWSGQRSPAPSFSRRVSLRGMWYFHQTFGAYTFVPGALDAQSPYGGKYSVGFLRRWY